MKEELIKLYSSCFDDSKEYIEYFFNYKYKSRNTLPVEDKDKLVSALFIINKRLKLRGLTLSCPYIVGACTDVEYRGRGIMNKLIVESFNLLYKRGAMVTALYPFRHSFYEKQGFVTINWINKIKIEYKHTSYTYKEATILNAPDVKEYYDSYISQYDNHIKRSIKDWELKIVETKSFPGKTILVYDDNKLVGYAIYDNLEVLEAIGEGIDGIKELDGRDYCVPSKTGEEYVMLRVISPLRLLRRIKYPKEVTTKLKLRITDNIILENNIVIKLIIVKGRATIEPSDSYDYSISVEELAMIITGNNYNKIDIIKEIFPPVATAIFDKF